MRIPFATPATRVLFSALLASATLLATSCKDDEPAVATPAKDYTAIDDAIIQKYLMDNAITTATKQAAGFYYLPIRSFPTAYKPVVGNILYVRYTGYLMDGTIFDQNTGPNDPILSFQLGAAQQGVGQVIRGVDLGAALMRKGEIAELLIPSALAYGNTSPVPAIPVNSVLRFRIELVDVR